MSRWEFFENNINDHFEVNSKIILDRCVDFQRCTVLEVRLFDWMSLKKNVFHQNFWNFAQRLKKLVRPSNSNDLMGAFECGSKINCAKFKILSNFLRFDEVWYSSLMKWSYYYYNLSLSYITNYIIFARNQKKSAIIWNDKKWFSCC